MKIYQVNGAESIEIVNAETEVSDKVKIKVTHVMPTLSDVNLFSGSVKREYPFVPGHIAIGVVSDDRDEYGLKRGTKVILNPYITDQMERLDFAATVKTRGIDTEGFMKDFVFLGLDEFVPFPEEVEEEDAIFVDKIAVAMSAINSFRVEKGDYIAIIGGNAVCNILAQLALYFQLIPIIIDDNEYRLEKAKQKGIFYTVNAREEVPYERVFEITGGRMCEHTVIEDTESVTGAYLFKLARVGGNCTIICEPYVVKGLDADVSYISKKQLKVKGVCNGAAEFSSAINIIAQNILSLDGFIEKKVSAEDAEEHFRELKENPEYYFSSWIEL
ncbi:MAG: alcohol dehydrogenase catalytic domain-containing protein [Christensenellales bacterium]